MAERRVKGFLSASDKLEHRFLGTFPSEYEPGLRAFTTTPAYLFAILRKAASMASMSAVRFRGVSIGLDPSFRPSPHVAQLTTAAIGFLLVAAVAVVLVQMIRERGGRWRR